MTKFALGLSKCFERGQIYGRFSWHMCAATIIKLFVDCSQHMECIFALKGSSRAVLPRGVSVCWAWTFGPECVSLSGNMGLEMQINEFFLVVRRCQVYERDTWPFY